MEIKSLHSWDLSAQQGRDLQAALCSQVTLCSFTKPIRWVAGTDLSYEKRTNLLYAGVVIWDCTTRTCVESAFHIGEATFPYITGLLSFREIPFLLEAFKKLSIVPDVLLCDGQGIAHPRHLGLASHLGLWLQLPTVGCAKTRLVGEFNLPSRDKGAESPLVYKDKVVGSVLVSKKGTRPLFISPGHLMDVVGSTDLVKMCLGPYRLPEPTRQAHLEVNRLRLNSFC